MPTAGPLAHSSRDVRLFLETVIKSKPWDIDYTALGMPWREIEVKKTLTVGVIYECPSWPVQPTILRALKTATEKLKAAGHNVVMLTKFPSFKEAMELSVEYFAVDTRGTGMKFIEDSGEPVVKSVKDLWSPPPEGKKTLTLANLFDMNAERLKYREQWLKIFVDNKLDVVVAPCADKTALPHDTFMWFPYSVMWNVLSVSL
jgi:amidase